MPSLALRSAALSAYRAIHQASEGREAKIELLEMLLDGLAASLAGIRNAELTGDSLAREAHRARATRIVAGLARALDPAFNRDLAESLGTIYKYILKRLNRLTSAQSSEVATELLGLTNKLRSAFLAN
jgi:flagellin-specific chaperone FliS